MPSSHYETLGVTTDADVDAIKRAYRQRASEQHPDLHPGDPAAEEVFRRTRAAYEVLIDPTRRSEYDRSLTRPATSTLRSKAHVYQVGGLVREGDVANLIGATDEAGAQVLLKGARDPSDDDLLVNEAKQLQALSAADPKYVRYLQPLRDTFVAVDSARRRRTINVFERLDGWWTLDAVRSRCPRLAIEHGVWMFNRLLEVLGYIHRQGLVHGAVVPSHVMAFSSTAAPSPWDHGIKLIDWCYAVRPGTPIAAYAPPWASLYAPEVMAKRPATPATDIYMAARTIMFVLPASVPTYLASFLRGCALANPAARPDDAWALLDEFKDYMLRHYGRKKYVQFTLPDTN